MKLIYLPFIIFSILSCKNQSTTQIEKLHIDNIIQIKGKTISQIIDDLLFCKSSIKYPFIYTPYYVDTRMSAQSSYFMVWGADPIALENIFTPEMYCMQFKENTNGRVYGNHERNALSFALYIHADRKQTLMRELDSVGINEKTLFPGLDGIGRYVEQRFRFNYNEAMQCL